jgi:hypothetical protein
LQKQALLDEPLSLDDLLRDDLDDAIEGPLSEDEGGPEGVAFETTGPSGQGGVIDYPDRPSPQRPARRPQERTGRQKPRGKPGFRAKHAKTGKNFQHQQRRGKPGGGRSGGGRSGRKGKGRRG